MLLKYRTTESFCEGFQKANIFAERDVRVSALIFVLFGAIVTPFKYLIPAGFKSESVSMIVLILFVFPLSTTLMGGISRRAWKLYAGFGVFFLLGLVPALWGFPVYLVFLPPAVLFLILFLRAEPKIAVRFGYSGKPVSLSEVLMALLSSAVFITITYIAIVMVTKTKFYLHPFRDYFFEFIIVVPEYFVAWGIMYGVLTKRLLNMKFEILIPILINVLLTIVWWAPTICNVKDPGMVMAGTCAWA
ncbi:MAG TPA: hypothetical protein PLQ76_02815, partial [bacterium]|nr:hypothetical protein [bacterium]